MTDNAKLAKRIAALMEDLRKPSAIDGPRTLGEVEAYCETAFPRAWALYAEYKAGLGV